MTNAHSWTPVAVALALLACCPSLRADAPRGEIVLRATDADGVKLIGAASLGKPSGKPDEVKSAGMEGEKTANVGVWSKRSDAESRVEFSPNIPSDGYYDLYVRWHAQTLRAKQADPVAFIVRFAGGERNFQTTSYSGYAWMYLGAYPLKAGRPTVLVADGTGKFGIASVHAIKLVPVTNPETALAPRQPNLPVLAQPEDAFDTLRVQYARSRILTANAPLDHPRLAEFVAQADADTYLHWKTMQKEPGQVTLWPDLPINQGKPIEKNEGGGWPLVRTFDRVAGLARAYVGCNAQLGFADKMQGNPELLKDILFALEWLYENRYNERSANKMGAEWIGMEVSIPRAITTTLLLLRPHVPQELVDKELKAMSTISWDPLESTCRHASLSIL